MNVTKLNALVEAAYEEALGYEQQLSDVYVRAFNRTSREAVAVFRAQAVTAAGFVPPPLDTMTSGLSEKEQAEANGIRDEAARAIAATLSALGLAAVAASFMAAISARGAANFDEEALRVLRSTVDKGLAEGWTADETAVAIRDAFRHVSQTTAAMLAQTELTTLVNERSIQAAQKFASGQAAPLYKTWQTMKDPKVRPAHAATQGQTVPVDQPFNVSGFQMMFPGDPSAPMRLVARCRCRMTYTETLVASAKEDTIMSTVELQSDGDFVIYDPDRNPVEYVMDDPITAAVTITIDDDAAEAEDAAAAPMADGPAWRGLLAVEGVATEDGRMLAEGSLTWRELPLTLTAMDTSQHGAEGEAKVAGRIDNIWRDGNEIWGEGVFNTDEFGTHIYELVSNQSLRGNSIEPAVLAYEIRNRETGEVLEGEAIWDAVDEGVPLLTVFLEAIIMCSTIVATPALADANIILASGVLRTTWFQDQDCREALTAAGAGLAPLHPPTSWFTNPGFTGPTALTVTPEGRVMGHAALWDSCHIGEPSGPGVCVPPPRSGMNYEIFHHGVVTTDDGTDVPCGQITMSTFHAGYDLSWKATLEHYENSGCAVADVIAGEDRFGIWVSGGLRPDLPAARVREMKAGALSGDWREVIGRGLEFLAALVVNIPGFPIPRPGARIAASATGEERVLALVAAGMVTDEDVEGMSRREYLRKIEALTY